MSLHDYQRKRDFRRTTEPSGDVAAGTDRPIFVVQLHHASSRHYDFRLQVGDVLKSWAVPKGPSFNPAEKRLAIEVEDHPLDYAGFEGDIEEGYGKGHVDRFDQGLWSTEDDVQAQLAKGHLRFQLFGQRLRGSWHLVRSHRKQRQPAWFLIKVDDAFAAEAEADDLLDAKLRNSTRQAAKRAGGRHGGANIPPKQRQPPGPRKLARGALRKRVARLPKARARPIDAGFYRPELTRLASEPPTGPGWLHEIKWDGYRLLATIGEGEVQLWSRNGIAWTERLPEIRQALAELGLDSARLDGELIALDEDGRSDFNRLQQVLAGESNVPLLYMLFDCPALEGYDLGQVALEDRKALLAQVLKDRPAPLAYSLHLEGSGADVFRMAQEQRYEGIVSKRLGSGYRAGRGDDWRKIKRLLSDEFALLGYTPPQGSRQGFGALLLGRPDPDHPGRWLYAGRVGTGFSDADLVDLGKRVARDGQRKPPVPIGDIDPLLREARWVKPRATVEVFYRGLGGNGLLRQASFKGLRPDKSTADLRDADRPAADSRRGKPMKKDRESAVVITHPDRLMFAAEGITKQAVADYYKTVMDVFLPGVVDRPTSVMRCPDGADKACFFQKHGIEGLHRVDLVSLDQQAKGNSRYLVPRGPDAIIELVQFGAIEFHPWGATAEQPDEADRLVFDLDPGPGVSWKRVVAGARHVREKLASLGLQSFLRTTGGKGLHVVVPLKPSSPWPMAKDFAHAFASSLAAAEPQQFIDVAAKAQRKGKIYLDYLRNSRGATSIASYSLRARTGAPVAVPIRWDELGRLRGGDHYTLQNVPARLARLNRDPWDGFGACEQTLDRVLDALQADAEP